MSVARLRDTVASWPILLVGALVTAIVSLSVHVVMLQVFNVPYPSHFPHTGWPAYPVLLFATLSAIIIERLAADRLRHRSIWVRCGVLFLLIAMLREQLIRAPLMNVINSKPYSPYPLVEYMPPLILIGFVACLVVLASRRMQQQWQQWVGALVISAAVFFVVKPPVDLVFGRILHAIAYLDSNNRFNPPYDYHIEIPAYLTFAEPVLASFATGMLVWNRLSRQPLRRILQLAALIFLMKGPVASPFINILYAGTDAVTAMLSEAQFSFESMSLGLLTAITLALSLRGRKQAVLF